MMLLWAKTAILQKIKFTVFELYKWYKPHKASHVFLNFGLEVAQKVEVYSEPCKTTKMELLTIIVRIR